MKEQDVRNPATFNRYLELVQEDIYQLFSDTEQFSRVACPACGGQDHNPEFTKVGFRYVTCKACGTLFASPRPSQASLEEFYVNGQSSIYWVEEFFRPVAEAIVAGCTEIPLLLKDEDIPVPLLEPMRIGARVCIRKAGYKIRA